MKHFKLVEIYSLKSYTSEDRIITREAQRYLNSDHSYLTNVTLGVLVVVKADFNLDNVDNIILDDTDSYQIRPKALYKSSQGIYYKDGSKRKYLSKEDIEKLKSQNKKLGRFL